MNRHAMELHQRFTPSCGGQPPGDLREVLASYKEMAQGDAELLAALVLGDRDTPGALKEYLDFHAYGGAKAGEIVQMVGGPIKAILPHVPDTLLNRMAAASVAAVRGLGDEAGHAATQIGVLKDRLLHEKATPPCRFGLDRLDRLLGGGIFPGDLMVLTAGPGSGKTSLALSMAEAAVRDGLRCAFFSIDMGVEALLTRRLQSRLSWPEWRIRQTMQGDRPELDREALESTIRKMHRDDDGQFLTFGPGPDGGYDDDRLLTTVAKHSPDLVVIDYCTLLKRTDSRGRQETDFECVCRVVPRLLTVARQMGLSLLVLSQMGRDSRRHQAQGGIGGHGRGGGLLEERAHTEIELQRFQDGDQGRFFASVSKNRRGSLGDFELHMEVPGMKFTDAVPVRRAQSARKAPFEGLM